MGTSAGLRAEVGHVRPACIVKRPQRAGLQRQRATARLEWLELKRLGVRLHWELGRIHLCNSVLRVTSYVIVSLSSSFRSGATHIHHERAAPHAAYAPTADPPRYTSSANFGGLGANLANFGHIGPHIGQVGPNLGPEFDNHLG